jgi:hypothetical protein
MRTRWSVAVLVAGLAAGCGGSSEPPPAAQLPPTATTESAPTTTAPPPEPPEATPKPRVGLPGYTAGYDEWTRLTRKPIPPRESGDPHLGTKEVFASKKRRANGLFPNGTIIVKEAQRPGREFIGLIAVMRKERGADPAHNDWRFIEWTRDSPDERFAVTARDAVCWSCHAGAEQTDYVWIYTLGLSR